jgi:hypothetical protein
MTQTDADMFTAEGVRNEFAFGQRSCARVGTANDSLKAAKLSAVP